VQTIGPASMGGLALHPSLGPKLSNGVRRGRRRWRNFILLARTNEVYLWESGGFLHLYGQKPPNFSLVPLKALAIT